MRLGSSPALMVAALVVMSAVGCTMSTEQAVPVSSEPSADVAGVLGGGQLIGTCPLDMLEPQPTEGDGAGGHSILLIAFTNTSNAPCRLEDPLGATAMPGGLELERDSFFPFQPYDRPLEPRGQAFLSLDTTSCNLESGRAVESVAFEFEGFNVSIPVHLVEVCGLRWHGFRVWE